ncbi:MAG: hypothetical protein B7Z58_01795 [Acidiphilium sp. 37-64-53]|uniref:hypothetical protein n=1 Tax=Acidiphilium TaxID=522 RepID=UPI000BC8426C|nr:MULTISPECIES: hypothetical protein [Acidiphilium]OYW03929.1 MAG: hypothetical protein B7Z58_01795 [Acidiphilium sp. 37-64-53]OZB21205.1 MAG: hypothetical protein B7X49_17985 [Acidiphilium sp. 34-64-41]HQT83862.1 hypothetical protein [Acidiphilium rubrum]
MSNKTELAITELMTGTAVRSHLAEVSDRAAKIKGEAAWQSELAELARAQAEEIDRLNLALQDAAAVPPRRPLLATGSIATRPNGSATTLVVAIDDHGTCWMIHDGDRAHARWDRLPDLPGPLEIARTLETANERAEREAEAEAEAVQAEMDRLNGTGMRRR